jgi:hypothetical protein
VQIESEGAEDTVDLSEPGCALEESVWDAILLAGIRLQGHASSLWTVMLMLVSVLVQMTFVFIVVDDLAEAKIDKGTASGLRAWRTNIAHLPYAKRKSHTRVTHLVAPDVCRTHVDPISKSSLAARVCSNDAGLEFNSQAGMFGDITRYLGSSISKGVLLLVLCLFTWLNSVIADASGALQMISAV